MFGLEVCSTGSTGAVRWHQGPMGLSALSNSCTVEATLGLQPKARHLSAAIVLPRQHSQKSRPKFKLPMPFEVCNGSTSVPEKAAVETPGLRGSP